MDVGVVGAVDVVQREAQQVAGLGAQACPGSHGAGTVYLVTVEKITVCDRGEGGQCIRDGSGGGICGGLQGRRGGIGGGCVGLQGGDLDRSRNHGDDLHDAGQFARRRAARGSVAAEFAPTAARALEDDSVAAADLYASRLVGEIRL